MMIRPKGYILATLIMGLIATSLCFTEAAEKKPQAPKPTAAGIPIYHPPIKGGKLRRVGGGSRGVAGKHLPYLAAIAPEGIGYTTQAQPVLYWYTPGAWAKRAEFALNNPANFTTLVEADITEIQPGFQRIPLADIDVHLEEGVEYEWCVALVLDPKNRSKDIVTSGIIKRVHPTNALTKALTSKQGVPYFIYAENGIWYDAFANLAQRIQDAPHAQELLGHRRALLDQIGLTAVNKRLRERH